MQVVCKMSENSCGDEMGSMEVLGRVSVFFGGVWIFAMVNN